MKIESMQVVWVSPMKLRGYSRNARVHSQKQVRQIAESIERFGFNNPILVDDNGIVIAGHGRLEAAKLLELQEVPTIKLSHLSSEERRAYVIADNKLAENASWDSELLALELGELSDLDFDLELTGFSTAEIDLVLDASEQSSTETNIDSCDVIPEINAPAVTRPGDLWRLGRHTLLCGDALSKKSFKALMGASKADIIFTDPPYNVPINGHVCGLGKVRHREFAMAGGEMSSEEFTEFLKISLQHASDSACEGTIAYVCMDWRHMRELLDAGSIAFDELKNVCVWNKTNGGMGAFYRSKHELIFVFKKGGATHINNFGLGENGRYRTNVWDYAGISSIGASRDEELAMHPTVKPVALITDALLDCSRRGDIVLDPFGGSGSTLISAQRTGRVARIIELDPVYCDTIIHRFKRLTGKHAILDQGGVPFEEVALLRGREGDE